MPAPPPLSDPATVRATAVELLRFTQPPVAILPWPRGNATRRELSAPGEDPAVHFGGFLRAAKNFDEHKGELHRGAGRLAGHNRAVNHDALFREFLRAGRDFGPDARVTGCRAPPQHAVRGEDAGRGA